MGLCSILAVRLDQERRHGTCVTPAIRDPWSDPAPGLAFQAFIEEAEV